MRLPWHLGMAIIAAMHWLPQIAHADAIQASALATSISYTLTLGSGTFPSSNTSLYGGGTEVNGDLEYGLQNYSESPGASLISSFSAGPLQVTDPATGSIAQSSAGFTGTLNGQRNSLTVSTNATASATAAFEADALGAASAFGISLPAFSQATPATLEINLMSDYGTNPASALAMQISTLGNVSPGHNPQAYISSSFSSNIVGAANLFGFDAQYIFDAQNPFIVQSDALGIAQPISASDFTAGPNGAYSLNPAYSDIVIPFTIPAGIRPVFTFGTGVQVQMVPEPATVLTAGIGFFALAGLSYRRRSINKGGCHLTG